MNRTHILSLSLVLAACSTMVGMKQQLPLQITDHAGCMKNLKQTVHNLLNDLWTIEHVERKACLPNIVSYFKHISKKDRIELLKVTNTAYNPEHSILAWASVFNNHKMVQDLIKGLSPEQRFEVLKSDPTILHKACNKSGSSQSVDLLFKDLTSLQRLTLLADGITYFVSPQQPSALFPNIHAATACSVEFMRILLDPVLEELSAFKRAAPTCFLAAHKFQELAERLVKLFAMKCYGNGRTVLETAQAEGGGKMLAYLQEAAKLDAKTILSRYKKSADTQFDFV